MDGRKKIFKLIGLLITEHLPPTLMQKRERI